MLLTKHEGETFYNQTVYISGQAFIRCTFTACTLVLRETIYHLQECTFERCNWHVDWVLLWGSPESLKEIKALVTLIEQAQAQMPEGVEAKATNTNSDTPFAEKKGHDDMMPLRAKYTGRSGRSCLALAAALAALFVCAAFSPRALALEPDEIALVINANLPASRALAEFYAKERNIPAGRIIALSIGTGGPIMPPDDIAATDYEPTVAAPIRAFLRQNHLESKVKCLVTFWGIPLRVGSLHISAEELTELKSLREELTKTVTPRIARDVADAEALAKSIKPDFKPGVGSDLESLAKRAQSAASAIAEALPKMTDPAQQRAKLDQFMPIFEELTGTGQALAEVAKTPLASLASEPITTEQLAGYREKIAGAQEQVATLAKLKTIDARAAIRKLIGDNFGVFAYAQAIDEQKNLLDPAQSDAALDSELSLLWWHDAYPKHQWIQNFLNFKVKPGARLPGPPIMVMRLDGPNEPSVHDLITTSVEIEKTGLQGQVALDARGLPKDNVYGSYDQTIRNLADLLEKKTKLQVTLDNKPALFPDHSQLHVALYCGWYSVAHYHPCCQFEPGAVGFHVASFEMQSLHNRGTHGWCRGLMLDGINATLGPVNEPYLASFPPADEFFPLLLTGKLPLAEVYWKTTTLASWMQCCVGDPLYTPYKANPQLKVEDLPPALQAIFKSPPPATAPAPISSPVQK